MKDNFHKQILDHAHDLIWAIDMEGRFTYINDNISSWGYDKNELIGKPFLDILNTKQIGKRYTESTKLGLKRNFEMEVLDKRGAAHMVAVSSSPLQGEDGAIIGMMGIIRDISATQKLEDQLKNEERLSSLGRLATGIAHEIRNPLSSVKMNLSILVNRTRPEGVDLEHFLIAQKEVARLETIVNEILDYAKPLPLKLKRTDIRHIVKDAIITIKPVATNNAVTIVECCDTDLPLVMVDRSKMTQVILNLLHNAIDASAEGDTVEIGAKSVMNGLDTSVLLYIKDQGEGIPAEHLRFIFDPFFTLKKNGTGLGLSIVKHIVDCHGGAIRIQSDDGVGTTVNVTIPV